MDGMVDIVRDDILTLSFTAIEVPHASVVVVVVSWFDEESFLVIIAQPALTRGKWSYRGFQQHFFNDRRLRTFLRQRGTRCRKVPTNAFFHLFWQRSDSMDDPIIRRSKLPRLCLESE
jgi:hypothetical protein